MLSIFTTRRSSITAAVLAFAGLGLPGIPGIPGVPGLTAEADASPRRDGATIAVGSHAGVKHARISVGGKFGDRGKGRVEAGNHSHAGGGVTVLAYRGGDRHGRYDRGHYRRGHDRYDRHRGHGRGHAHGHRGHGPSCTTGYYKRVWVDPIYRTVYPRFGRPYRVLVRAGYFRTVWVPGRCGHGCGLRH